MEKKLCPQCGEEFVGRRNKIYCSTPCKTVVNNAHYIERNSTARVFADKVRENRNILDALHKLFEKKEIPGNVIKSTKLDYNYCTFLTYKGEEPSTFFNDYELRQLGNKNYSIFKAQIK